MSQQELELPKGWVKTKLDDVVIRISNGTSEKQTKEKTKFPVTRIETISDTEINFNRVRYLKNCSKKILDKYKMEYGDILFSNINSDSHLGKTAIFHLTDIELIHGMNLLLIRSNREIILPKLLNFIFNYHRTSGFFYSIAQHAVNQSSINQTRLKKTPILLPPLNEQKRIVSKIEELFSKIDSTKQSLEHTKLQLEQYKKSLLTSAFEGKLTDAKQYDDQLEIPKLLQLIESERNDIFLKTILKNNLSGDRFKQISPREYNPENMPISTKKWHIVSLETICSFVQAGSTPLRTENSNFSETGFPLIKVENILKNGEVFLKNNQLRITPKPHNKMWRSKVFPDDILINIVGPPLGKIGLVPKKFPESNINQAIVLMRTVPSYLNKFLLFCLQSPKYYDYQLKLSSGVRQENIRKSSIGTIPIPLPSLKEQKEIVSQIEQGFSLIENTSQIIESTLQNLQTMKMSVLKQAFEGKLVPQDPNDEPASVLLERIKSTKESQSTKQRGMKNVK